jgi:heptosyltransferase III
LSVLDQLPHGSTVAVIRLRSLGDTVLITPALRILRAARPDLWIAVLLDRPLAPLLEGSPDVDQAVAVDRHGRGGLIAYLRDLRPTLCLNLHGGGTSAWLTALSGARFRAGYRHFFPGLLYNVRIPRAQRILGRASDAPVHTAEHHASAIFHLGAPAGEIPAARLAAESFEAPRESYAVYHVAASHETKRWPADRFLAVARVVEEAQGLRPVFLAGPGQDELLAEFPKENRAKSLPIRELKQILSGAGLFVGNDSGPAHVAAAFGVPSVVVFGDSDVDAWRPWGGRGEAVVGPVRGAGRPPIESVEPDAVEAAVQRVLAR